MCASPPRHGKCAEISALILAAKSGHRQCVELLIKAGADACSAALLYAIKEGHHEYAEALIKGGAGVNGVCVIHN